MGPELFGVGAAEAVLVFVIALILVGPQRFPDIARQGGRWYRVARGYTAEITKDVRAAIDELEEEVKASADDLNEVRELGEEMGADLQQAGTDLDKIGAETERDMTDQPAGRSAAPTAAEQPAEQPTASANGAPAAGEDVPARPGGTEA
ncbi:MAG: twin-arginine translocase TatA/TatE family subunit [Dehalococcoidia bacterium]|jgi:sec-independent protein translocase protein TatB|nr:twin-arginine translocase TatA/TatE family subunit [Dehalococcoidia bacterium]